MQIQPRKDVLDHAGCTGSAQQHELGPTDHADDTDHTEQESIYLSALKRLSFLRLKRFGPESTRPTVACLRCGDFPA